MDAVVNFFERHLKVVGVGAERTERGVVHNPGGIPAQNFKRDFRVRLAGDLGEGQAREFFRQVQTPVRRLALEQGLAQVHARRGAVGAVKCERFHGRRVKFARREVNSQRPVNPAGW